MESCQVILRSGAKVEVKAKVMLNDTTPPHDICFFSDHDKHVLVATFKRDAIAGVIFHPVK